MPAFPPSSFLPSALSQASALRVRHRVAPEATHAVLSTQPIGGLVTGPMDAFGEDTSSSIPTCRTWAQTRVSPQRMTLAALALEAGTCSMAKSICVLTCIFLRFPPSMFQRPTGHALKPRICIGPRIAVVPVLRRPCVIRTTELIPRRLTAAAF